MEEWNTYQIYTAFVLYVGSTCLRLILWRLPREESKSYDGEYYRFHNALFMIFLLFFTQALCGCCFVCLVLYMKRKNEQRLESSEEADGFLQRITAGNMNFKVRMFITPALIEYFSELFLVFGSSLTNRGAAHSAGSFTVLIVPTLSKLYCQLKYPESIWRGVILVCIGYVFIGIGRRLNSVTGRGPEMKLREGHVFSGINETNETSHEHFIHIIYIESGEVFTGFCIIIIGVIGNSAFKVMVEVFTKREDVPPLIAVFWMGVYGGICAILMFIPGYFIQREEYSSNPDGRYEDLISVIVKISNNYKIAFILFGLILFWGIYIVTFVTLSKEVDATTSEVVFCSSAILAFVIELHDVRYREALHWIEYIGYSIILIGTLVYFDLVFGPCMSRFMSTMEPSASEVRNTEQQSWSSSDEISITKNKGTKNVLHLRELTLEY